MPLLFRLAWIWTIPHRSHQSIVLPSLSILYEDNHLLAIDKPAGLPTMGVAHGQSSAVKVTKEYLKRKYDKPGNVYIGVVSRLDALASGVLMLARTSKAAARLNEQFKGGHVEKTYLALVAGTLVTATGELSDYVLKDENAERMRVVGAGRAGAKHAILRYRRLASVGQDATLVDIQLLTGRKHQIRLQFGSRGLPILGDRKYGSSTGFPSGIALHARQLVVEHPVKRERLDFTAPIPNHWRQWLSEDEVVRLLRG
jgi:23S rRNA pseudouridine1911/1915/1917 synthase